LQCYGGKGSPPKLQFHHKKLWQSVTSVRLLVNGLKRKTLSNLFTRLCGTPLKKPPEWILFFKKDPQARKIVAAFFKEKKQLKNQKRKRKSKEKEKEEGSSTYL